LKMKNNFRKEKTLLPVLMMISRKQKKWFLNNYIFIEIFPPHQWPRHFEFFFFLFLILVFIPWQYVTITVDMYFHL
jgi:hypothetical protein